MPNIEMPEDWDSVPIHVQDLNLNVIYSLEALHQQHKELQLKLDVSQQIIDRLIEENKVAADFIKNQ